MKKGEKEDKAFYQVNLYLDEWKKELDNESLNKDVLNCLLSQKKKYKRVLDVGTGSGVQIRRNIELGLIKNNGEIIGLDVNEDGLKNSRASFEKWADQRGYKMEIFESDAVLSFVLSWKKEKCSINLYSVSVYDLGTEKTKQIGKDFELVTALSLLEHTDMNKSLSAIHKIMKKGGLFYANINYDQHSVFGPTSSELQKNEINLMQLFNYAAIDYQFRGNVDVGNSKCGSLLPSLCSKNGLQVLKYGSSDWVIAPGNAIPYTQSKKNVLKFFVDAFNGVLKGASQETKEQFKVNNKIISDWYNLRIKQLNSGELYYTCVQKDILCKK